MSRAIKWLPLGGLLLLVAHLGLAPVTETDSFFRLRVGEEILGSHSIPRRNLFSFTYPDHPDLDPAWLFDAGVAALHRAGGFPAIVLAKTALLLAIFAAAHALCRRRGAGPVGAALALGAAALVMRERLVERPHLFSLAGEVTVLWALAAWHGRRLWLLVPVTALWANLHAGAFIGPGLVALAGVSERSKRLALVAVACAAALLLTPAGPGIFRYLLFHADIFALHPVDEFRPPSWTSDAPLLVYAGAVAAALAWTRSREALSAVVLALFAARSVRFGADFALVTAPVLAVALSAAGQRLAAPLFQAATGAALAALAVVPRLAGGTAIDLDLDESALPLEALAFVERHGLRERMYNDFEVGAYLLWEGYPRHRVFVDPRLPAYPREFHQLLGRAVVPRAEWDAALERHGVTTALLVQAGINHRISFWDPARWALVYRRHDARVFVRRLPRWRSFIAAHEIPATYAFTPTEGASTLLLDTPPPESPVPLCEWQRRVGDLAFELDAGRPDRALAAYRRALAAPGCLAPAEEAAASAWVGAVALTRHDPAAALVALDRALIFTPDDLPTLTNRALALDALGRRREAAAAWSDIAGRARGTPLGDRAARLGRF